MRPPLPPSAALALLVLLALGLATPGHARAAALVPKLPPRAANAPGDADRAARAYDRAARAYEKKDLKTALSAANEAFEILPNASTALSRAVILERAGVAQGALESYLVAAELSPTDDERRLIEEGLARVGKTLSPPMTTVTIIAQPAGAAVEVDGVPFLAPRLIAVDAGKHVVKATAPGYEPLSDTFVARPGRSDRVELSLVPDATSSPLPTDDPLCVSARETSSGSAAPWIVTGAGVAVMALGVGFHLAAADAADDSKHFAKPGVDGLPEDVRLSLYRRAVGHAEDQRTVAYAAYGIGAAAVITGVILIALDDDDAPAGDASKAKAAPPAAAWVSPDGAGLELHGSF
ncbi:MAG: PEGA domain-containing protein [Myxococcales bacterium]|nr:PEGA domain-containing protein [Myxococcales bacterium]